MDSNESPQANGLTMSIADIRARFDGEWVLIEDPETTESPDVERGRVLWHSKDRDEVYRKAMELRPKHSATLYIGVPSDDEVLILSVFHSTC
jgi:hypothetical protein